MSKERTDMKVENSNYDYNAIVENEDLIFEKASEYAHTKNEALNPLGYKCEVYYLWRNDETGVDKLERPDVEKGYACELIVAVCKSTDDNYKQLYDDIYFPYNQITISNVRKNGVFTESNESEVFTTIDDIVEIVLEEGFEENSSYDATNPVAIFDGEPSEKIKKKLKTDAFLFNLCFSLFATVIISIIYYFMNVEGNKAFIPLIVAILLIASSFLTRGKSVIDETFPNKIAIYKNIVIKKSKRGEQSFMIEKVKKVVDYGDYYQIYFGQLFNNAWVCQKDLLTAGSLQEFRSVFRNKMK